MKSDVKERVEITHNKLLVTIAMDRKKILRLIINCIEQMLNALLVIIYHNACLLNPF